MTINKENFDYLQIRLASPQRIKEWGQRVLPNGEVVGEVTKSETLNYRTLKPEPYGLLCQKIFGPIKSWECYCRRYKYRPRKKNMDSLFCENCGVELTESRVRRHRLGYIKLNFPVSHVWYLKGSPSYISLMLEIPLKKLEKIIYFHDESYEDEEGFLMKFLSNEKPFDILKENENYPSTSGENSSNLDSLKESLDDLDSIKVLDQKNVDDIKNESVEKELSPSKKLFSKESSYEMDDNILDDENLFDEEAPFDFSSIIGEIFGEEYNRNGANLILELLNNLNLEDEIKQARNELIDSPQTKKEKIIKRIRILENFIATKSNPAWMILTILPVLPPALRPILELDSGRLATSDLNEHYRRIITRNNRLQRLIQRFAPINVVCNEKRMLQESVDALIDNGKRGGKIAYSLNNRPLKCLSDIISGKQGRFRQNLLGKRVDYSGRSVIIVGPNLKLNQCGLPYEMAVELFNPFLIYYLIKLEVVRTIRPAKMLIENNVPIIWDIIQLIAHEHPILLNRAPTLHRLGIQAFEPIITNGRALQLHPLACPAFNADFDGDQMAVHIPLSEKAKAEARTLMLSSRNFLSPATGRPILTPSQDMVLGCYYLTTRTITDLKGADSYFLKFADVLRAFEHEKLTIHSPIWVKYSGKVVGISNKLKQKHLFDNGDSLEIYDDLQIKKNSNNKIVAKYIRTTPGRIMLNEAIAAAIKSSSYQKN